MHIFARFSLLRRAALLALAAMLLAVPAAFAQELKPIELPKPQITGGMPLMQTLVNGRPHAPSRTSRCRCKPFRICFGRPLASTAPAKPSRDWAAPRPRP